MMSGAKKKAAKPLPLADVDRIIHEPARLHIVAVLEALEHADFLFLERETGLTRGNLSSHLTKLEHAGYIVIEKTYVEKIPRTVVALTDEGRAAFSRYRKTLLSALG